MTLKTEVEAGASGYSVTGGGVQGIFVKHVLKGSSAAKLFSLREGAMATPPREPRGQGHTGAQEGHPPRWAFPGSGWLLSTQSSTWGEGGGVAPLPRRHHGNWGGAEPRPTLSV